MTEVTLGVLRMPYDMFWSNDIITRYQNDHIRLYAADEIERLQNLVAEQAQRVRELETRAENAELQKALEDLVDKRWPG
jgi:hypothetical protein